MDNNLFGISINANKNRYDIKTLLNKLSDKDKEILRIASNAIYFNDNSDYLSALWEVVNFISKDGIEECDSELFELLNEE